MKKYFRRTWVEVSLDALRHNYNEIKNTLSPGCDIIAVVKADAYGHGVENTVREFSECGCRWFAVSNLEEAMQVRSANADCSILILGYTPAEYAAALAVNNISQAVFNIEYARSLSEKAVESGVQVSIHIKADTGMSRLGFAFRDSVADAGSISQIAEACRLPGLYPEGIFTHFACADEREGEVFTRFQFELFTTLIRSLEFEGITFPFRHCCNSAATILYPEMHLDLVRPGIILYGLMPSEFLNGKISLIPAMKMKTVVSMTKTIPDGTPVSYGRIYTGEGDTTVATVPVGYADGYPRALSGKAFMRVGGATVPVIGRICMDQFMCDVTEVEDVKAGDEAVLIGAQGNEKITADDIGKMTGTIGYEIVCGISARVPRVISRHGEQTAVLEIE